MDHVSGLAASLLVRRGLLSRVEVKRGARFLFAVVFVYDQWSWLVTDFISSLRTCETEYANGK